MSSDKLLSHPEALMNILRRIALQAGELTLKYFDEGGYHGADAKADGSPVTLADQEAEIYIEAELLKILPEIPMIGEESVADGRKTDLSDQRYFWLVDPLDGTKSFIKGEDSYTVNIALIRDHKPFIGVVYAPASGQLYAGYHDPDTGAAKAIRWSEETGREKDISVRPPPESGLVVATSKNHGDPGKLDDFLRDYKVQKHLALGSSLKMCFIAIGKADIYPRFGPTCEWDTAAAHAVLNAAGGMITDVKGDELHYGGRDPGFLNPEFIASGFDWRLPG